MFFGDAFEGALPVLRPPQAVVCLGIGPIEGDLDVFYPAAFQELRVFPVQEPAVGDDGGTVAEFVFFGDADDPLRERFDDGGPQERFASEPDDEDPLEGKAFYVLLDEADQGILGGFVHRSRAGALEAVGAGEVACHGGADGEGKRRCVVTVQHGGMTQCGKLVFAG